MNQRKGKPRYNRVIALARIEKAARLLESVRERWSAENFNWQDGVLTTGLLDAAILNCRLIPTTERLAKIEVK